MERYLLIDWQCGQEGGLECLFASIVDPSQPALNAVSSYQGLIQGDCFQKMMVGLLDMIHAETVQFHQTSLVTLGGQFPSVLSEECRLRGIAVPLPLTPHLSLLQIFNRMHMARISSLLQLADHYQEGIEPAPLQTLRTLLIRMHQEGLMDKQCPSTQAQEPLPQTYFKTIGWPFNVRAAQVIRMMITGAPMAHPRAEVYFVNQNSLFTGKVYVVVPKAMQECVMGKNKARVGSRYIEVTLADREEFASAELRYSFSRENIRKDFMAGPSLGSSPFQANPGQFRQSYPMQGVYAEPSSYRFVPQRRHHRSRSSSEGSYDRHRHRRHRRRHSSQERSQGDELVGVRIRGLPFRFQESEVFEIFARYGPIGGSVKLGHREQRRSGQAVMLFGSRRRAWQALSADGLTVCGRYLEVILISEEDYDRFK